VLEYVLVAGIVGEGYSIEGGGRSESAVPNTTDRSVVYHRKTFDLYLGDDVGNGGEGGGGGGNYSVTIELDRTAPLSTDLKFYHLHATLVALGYVQVPDSE